MAKCDCPRRHVLEYRIQDVNLLSRFDWDNLEREITFAFIQAHGGIYS